MKPTLRFLAGPLVALLALSLPAVAQTISTWKGGIGSWDDGTKWTGPVPNSTTAVARVDNSNAMDSEVTLVSSITVGQLLISRSDLVRVLGGLTLTVNGTGNVPGKIEGRLELTAPVGGTSTLFVNGDVAVDRSGSVVGGAGGNVITGTAGSTLTVDSLFVTGVTQAGGGALNFVVNGAFGLSAAGGTINAGTSFVLNEGASLTAPVTGTLAGTAAYTLNGTIVLNNGNASSSLTKEATATLTNYDAGTGTLTGGRYLLINTNGATVNLNVGPIVINNAEIQMVRPTSNFAGLESLQQNHGVLSFNNKPFTLTSNFTNTGEFTVSQTTFTAPGITNSGRITLQSFSGGGDGILSIGASGYTQSAGSFGMNGTSVVKPLVNSNGPFVVNGGRLEGGGQITAPTVQCFGTLAPFTKINQYSSLQVVGSLTLGGITEIRLGRENAFGKRQDSAGCSGALVIGGELRLYVGSVADPDPAASFPVLGGASRTGTFSNVANGERLKTIDGRGSFLVSLSSTTVTLSAWEATPARALGLAVPGESVGTTFTRFGPPAQGPFGGSKKLGTRTAVAIFAGDGRVRAEVGGTTVLSPTETLYSVLGEPSGDAALATVRLKTGAISAKNDQLLLGGLINGPVRLAVREGVTEATGLPGVTVKSFTAIEGSPTADAPIFFRAMLQGGGTTAKDDMALCAAFSDGTWKVLVREGETVGLKKVTIIGTLVAATGSAAEGRWRAGDQALGVKLTFVGGSNAVYKIPVTATSSAQWELLLDTETVLGAPFAGVKVLSLGLPAFGENSVAVAANLKVTPNVVKATDDRVIFVKDGNGIAVLAREGFDAPGITGAKFRTFVDPVCGAQGSVAFQGTAFGDRVTSTGIWYAPSGGSLDLLKRVTDDAPGGGKFASFTTLALPDGATRGPIFTAKLAIKAPAVTAKNNAGIWAVNSQGTLVKLLRTGDIIRFNGEDREVRSFTALVSAPGSIGAARGYDNAGNATVLATFVAKKVNNIPLTTVGLVQLMVP